jgi:basic membrane lipoprotein Med (substrate-binding protein (PBP1-ABC) superfamily)
MESKMSIEDYKTALKMGEREKSACLSKNEDPYLPILDDLTENVSITARPKLGLVTIPVDQIVGTVNANRSNSFTRSFLPLLGTESEFASKWSHLYDSLIAEGLREPIIAFEYMNKFYVSEGNKRVSVSKYMDTYEIEANVTRLVPARDDSEENKIYYEFLDFYEKTGGINYIYFTKTGSFEKLFKLIAGEADTWDDDMRMDVRSLFTKFKKEYEAKNEEKYPLSVSDAFLLYVNIFGFNDIKNNTIGMVKSDIEKLRSEFMRNAQEHTTVISTHPVQAKSNIFMSSLNMLRAPKKLKIAFVYLGNIENSAWVYAHEFGRHYVEDEVFPNQVETEAFFDVSVDLIEETLEELCHNDYDMIFATSPQHNAACAKVAILHPEVKILNCSLNASTKNVRTYYLRTYESKFLMGIIAGAMTSNNRISYVADYPVYGSITSINAFALGAKMVNPHAQIYLSWTSVKNSNPEDDIWNNECDIVSNLDWSSPKNLTKKFGVYISGDTPINLAAPLWDWGKLYAAIIKSVMKGSWKIEESSKITQSIGYWWGLSSGAVDIVTTDRIPYYTLNLVKYLKERIKVSDFKPFFGKLEFQNNIVVDAGDGLTMEELVSMDKLLENIHGFVPGVEDVKDETVELTMVQGVKENN